jgi:DNA-binding MarR family transcriptional regulator
MQIGEGQLVSEITAEPHVGELQKDEKGYLFDPKFREVFAKKNRYDEATMLDMETIRAMVFAGKLAYAGFEDYLGGLDLSFPQFRALMCIDTFGRNGTQLHPISQWLGVTPRAVTGMVDALEAQGLVERVPDPTDRRAVIARTTEIGLAKARKALTMHASALRQVMGTLTEEEKLQLRHLSLKVLAAAKEAAAERRKANG